MRNGRYHPYHERFSNELAAFYSSRSYFVQSGKYEAFLSRDPIRSFRTDLSVFEENAFAILKPDAIATNNVRNIVNWLNTKGLEITLFATVIKARESFAEELYKYNLTLRNEHNQIGSWWLNRQLYTMGPMVLLMLRCKERSENVYDRLSALKGPSDPFKGRAGELRYDHRACNMTVNLFHCSDDPISSIREYLIFKPIEELKSFVESLPPRFSHEKTTDPFDWIDPKMRMIESSGFDVTDGDALRALFRFIARIAISGEFFALEGIVERFFSRQNVTGSNPLQSLDSARQSLAELTDQARRIIACNKKEAKLLTLLDLVADFPNICEHDLAAVIDEASTLGIETSDWDKLFLVSTAHYRSDIVSRLPSESGLQTPKRE